MKHCSNKNCKQINPQPLNNFSKDKNRKDGLCPNCKKCKCYYSQAWAKINPDKKINTRKTWASNNKERLRGAQLKVYWPNLTWEQALVKYNILLKEQNGVCKICSKIETAKDKKGEIRDLCVDHSHTTGKVRGLLCSSCNKGIGCLKDNIEILKSSIVYLSNN